MKALASDLDGTLVFDHRISQEDLEAIQKFQKAGNLFGLSTGRGAKMCFEAKQFQCDFIIASSGAQILIGNQTIYDLPINYQDVESIFNQYAKYTSMVIIQSQETGYIYGQGNEFLKGFKKIEELKDQIIYDISLIFDSEEETVRINNELKEKYPHLLGHQNEASIDIVDQQCSKGNAVKILKEYLKLDVIGGIGDSYNDISMLESADIGFTFPSSPKIVQDKATTLVDSVSEAIDQLL